MKQLFTIILSVIFASAAPLASAVTVEEIAALRNAADSLHSIGRTDSAEIVGRHAVLLAEKSGDPTQIVGTNAAHGVFLRSLGRIDEALKSYETALEIVTSGQFRENPDQEAIEEIASLYINLAVLNLDMQHKDEATANAVLAGDWIAKSDDPELKSTIYGVAGSVLTGCVDLGGRRSIKKKAYQNALAANDEEAAFRAAAYTMLIADRSGNKQEASVWREKCNALLPSVESMMARLVYYQAECSICLKNDDLRGSLKWFDEILALEGIDSLPFVKFDCYNNMHLAYAGLGDYDGAYSTLLKSNELRDTIWEQEKTESLRDLTVKYHTQETELALAQSETRRATVLMWLFGVVGLLLTGTIIFVIYANRQRHRRMMKEMEFAALREDIGRQLTRQYVEGLENERRRMSCELHDGVCNDLLAIQMNLSNGLSPECTAQLIAICRESVRRISHELMPPEFAYASLDEVVRYFVSKQAEANEGRIAIVYRSSSGDSAWTSVPDATALEVYRIIQEAVGNAVKHSGATEIAVSLDIDGKTLEAKIVDNGTYKSAARKGMGLESMRRRANSIGGSVVTELLAEGGTQVRLTVKI